MHRRCRVNDEHLRTFGREDALAGKGPPASFDEVVLRQTWDQIRVGFAMFASDIRDQLNQQGATIPTETPTTSAEFPYDLLYVTINDWPRSPVPVLQQCDLFGGHRVQELLESARANRVTA